MEFKYNDGGRTLSKYKGTASDCVVRSISIITEKPYQEVYDEINELSKYEKQSKLRKGKSSARSGVYKVTFHKYILSLGYTWIPTMFIGQGCKVHLKKEELPSGKLLVRLSKHLTAVIDGVINDTYDCSREETRCVYGYYKSNR